MSSHIADSISAQAERARERAQRSKLLGTLAAAAAVLLFAGFIVQSFLLKPTVQPKPQDDELPAKATVVNGTVSTFSGIDENHKPFEVHAIEGTQDAKVETLMHLEAVTGQFVRKAGGDVKVVGDRALYDIRSKDLSISGNVRFEEPGRYVAHFSSAEVNLDRQRIISHDPVQVETDSAKITADRMETSEDGSIVRLNGHVKARFATEIGHIE